MFPTPPADVPPDPVTPVPPPTPSHMAPLSRGALAMMLAGLSMLGPLSIDTYLPAFGAIQGSLQASPLEVQQSLTFYMLAFAGMVLWHGAISDTFGRRNVILVSLLMFSIGSLGCASAHTVHYLWFFRIMQGVSAGAGVVISRAIIRDLYSDAAAARLLSLVTMIFSIAPAVAPILGGWIVIWFDWRSIFLFLAFYTLVLLAFCYWRLPETLPLEKRQPFNPRFLASSYGQILRSPLFHIKAGIVALNFAGLFLFITAAPEMLPKQLGLGPSQFGWLFIPCVSASSSAPRRPTASPARSRSRARSASALPSCCAPPASTSCSTCSCRHPCHGRCCPCSSTPSACRWWGRAQPCWRWTCSRISAARWPRASRLPAPCWARWSPA